MKFSTVNAEGLKKVIKMIVQPKNGKQKVTPFIQGKPGVGKSQIVAQVAQELGLEVIDYRLSLIDNTDLKGIPHVDGNSKFSYWGAPEDLPLASNPKFKGRKGILFLDEINRGASDVIQSCFQLVYDFKIGETRLADGWYLISAGNLGLEDGCDVNEFDAAFNGRLLPIRLETNSKDWITWAKNHGIHSDIIGFIKSNPKYLYFEDEKGSKEFITPRQWTQFSEVCADSDMSLKDFTTFIGQAFLGTVTAMFLQYLKDNETLSGSDVVNKFNDEMKAKIESYDLPRFTQLSDSVIDVLKNMKTWSEKQVKNIIRFSNILPDDQLVAFNTQLVTCNTPLVDDIWTKGKYDNLPEYKEMYDKLNNILISSNLMNNSSTAN